MIFIQETLQRLQARLPELEWKLMAGNISLNPKKMPAGLFHHPLEITPQSCINEIKSDLAVLSKQTNARSANYLAERISQKINVLVGLCQIQSDGKPLKPHMGLGMQAIHTRQQWLHSIQAEIVTLSAQQQALNATIAEHQRLLSEPQVILKIQAELGEVERRLTLAKETLARN